MKDIQSATLIQQLRDELNIAGPLSLRLDEVVTPVIAIAQQSLLPEQPYQASGTIISGAGGVGQRTDIYLQNPVGSGVIAIVRDVMVKPGPNNCEYDARIIQDVSTGSAVNNTQYTDSRRTTPGSLGKGGPQCQLAYTHNVASSSSYWIWLNEPAGTGNNALYPIPFGWIITAGFSFNVRQQNTNEACVLSFRWSEQPDSVNA